MIDRIGQQFGHYRLTRKLGAGGFADVYQAEHIYLNTLAAVKLLSTNLASGDMQNFHEEARIIAHLVHPHIVRVLDFGVEQDIPYLVMEYASKGTMRQRHPRGTQVPLSLVAMYVKQIAGALQYAHTHRLIHRDVKPENLLLGLNNKILLGDFGAALMTRTSLMLNPQNIIGTVSYMAPEQLQGKPSPASDQYALGIVAYEWLCGYCPFQGSLTELYNLQLHEPPPSLRARMPLLSFATEQVVMKALAKRPEQRFPTIEAFAEALERTNNPIHSPAPLFLPGNAGVPGHAASLLTVADRAPSPLPPTMVAPPAAPFPETIIANAAMPAKPRLSRRTLLGALVGLTAISALAWGLALQEKSRSNATPAVTYASPTRALTPIPTKNASVYTYTGHQDQVFTAAWSPDSKHIASAGGNIDTRQGDMRVHVWEVQTGQEVFTYSGHSRLVRMVAWSPDGSRIASASEDKTVQVWDASTGGNLFTYTGHTNQVMSVAWSPDGMRIASTGLDGTVQVWDSTYGHTLFSYTGHLDPKGHPYPFSTTTWSPDGKLIAFAGDEKTVRIWDATLSTELHVFDQDAPIGSLVWSSDSKYITTGDYNDDDSVRIWNISTESNILVSPGKSGNQVYTVDWSPNGEYIAAGYQIGQVKIWHPSGEQRLLYTGHSLPVMSVRWSPHSNYITSCGFDKTVQVWTIA